MTKGDKKWLDDDYYWNIFYTGWRCVEQNNDD